MGLISRIGIAAAGLAASGTIVLFAAIGGAGAHADDGGGGQLRELASCVQSAPIGASKARVDGQMQQEVKVVVPATALIRVDAAGRVTAALTNTGCAPRPGDDIYVVHAGGSIDPTPTGELPTQRWVGDFTVPGVYVVQR